MCHVDEGAGCAGGPGGPGGAGGASDVGAGAGGASGVGAGAGGASGAGAVSGVGAGAGEDAGRFPPSRAECVLYRRLATGGQLDYLDQSCLPRNFVVA